MPHKYEAGRHRKCPECGASDNIVSDPRSGQFICSCCGVVVDSLMFDQGPEWRAYDFQEEQDRSRGGSPLSLLQPDFGIKTQISRSRKDGKGRKLSSSKRLAFNRLSSVDNHAHESEIRNLRIALRELKRLRSQMELPDRTAQMASSYYRQCLKKNLIRGRSIDGMIAASLYLACRKTQIPLTLKDIATDANVSSKELGRCVRTIVQHLRTRPDSGRHEALIHRLGEDLSLSMPTRITAVNIAKQTREYGITVGKNPMSIAAACLYIAGVKTGERRTQQQIARAANTTPVTIRNRFKEIVRVLRMDDIEVKRGAAAVPVFIEDPKSHFNLSQ
ncbi:MAG: transcription initiation factor IIB [Candidatus Heimdallarchaeota archaeon]|nr:MAG: transcription initiation factor IIB [Candidatus Heimdallarchaeota archaeon]